MSIRRISQLLVLVFSTTLVMGTAFGAEQFHQIFNDASREVKATSDPVQKRAILDNTFQRATNALNTVESMPSTSAADRAGIERYKSTIQDKQNELNGTNGYTRVADQQLNAFSGYVVQDMEQADQVITISLVTLLLIIILVFLIAR